MALVKERFNILSSDQKKKVVDYIAMSSLGRDYSIDVKEGINIQAHGAVSLDVLKQMQADILSVL